MDFNEWLLQDRIAIIKDVLVKNNICPIIIPSADRKRDDALLSILKLSGAYNCFKDEYVKVSSKRATEAEKEAPECAVYNDEHKLVYFYPLKPCDDDWIEWYLWKEEDRMWKH